MEDKISKKQSVFTIRLSEEELQKLDKYVDRMGDSRSNVVRKFILEGLSIHAYKEDIDLLSKLVRESVEAELAPRVERMLKLQAKTCMTSASSLFLLGDAIEKFVPHNERTAAREAIEIAKKAGVRYTQNRDEYNE